MPKSFTLEELAQITGAKLIGNPNHVIEDVDSLDSATNRDASFLSNPRYAETMKISNAGVVCVSPDTELQEGKSYLISENPSGCFQKIAEQLHRERLPTNEKGISPHAIIASDAEVGNDVFIGANVVIGSGCKIGDGTVIHPNVTIMQHSQIGSNCLIYPNVTLREGTILHNRVILQPGCVIGSCGFGYITDAHGNHQKLNQIGIVIIEDDCEIGANTTIDRARFKATLIKKGTKIDNLVQIGHNVELGEGNIIVSQTGIAGSSKTGKYVVMGGQTGVTGHIEIADHVQIATRGGVSKSIAKPGPYRGSPAIPFKEYNRYKVLSRNIESHVKRISNLEKKLREFEEKELLSNYKENSCKE